MGGVANFPGNFPRTGVMPEARLPGPGPESADGTVFDLIPLIPVRYSLPSTPVLFSWVLDL